MPYITPYQYYENGGDLPEDALSIFEGKIGSRPTPSAAETRMERYFTDPGKLVPGGIAKV